MKKIKNISHARIAEHMKQLKMLSYRSMPERQNIFGMSGNT